MFTRVHDHIDISNKGLSLTFNQFGETIEEVGLNFGK